MAEQEDMSRLSYITRVTAGQRVKVATELLIQLFFLFVRKGSNDNDILKDINNRMQVVSFVWFH